MTDETNTPIRWKAGESDKSVWRAEIEDYDYQPRDGCTTTQPIVQGDETICIVVSEGWDDTVLDERMALIAAAPELLEALKDARFALYGNGPGNPKIDAAIAKAEGRSK